ncbi:MAG TPA: hypothetical protein VMZ92_13830 [Planctomycetota bacterium]|nr:hypothetical protein [Planctomycetota bacterium]
MIRFKCERCGAVIKCADTIVGKHVACPTCRHKLIVPRKAAPIHHRLLLVAGLVAVLVAVVWVVWAVSGGDRDGRADGSSPADNTTRPQPGSEEALREFDLQREKQLREWEQADTARNIQREIDRAKWLADRKAQQAKEEAERKEAEERSRRGLPPKEATNP